MVDFNNWHNNTVNYINSNYKKNLNFDSIFHPDFNEKGYKFIAEIIKNYK